ncbi:MAG: hypothetical protein ACTSRZ_17670 [Promethearchaeota archaeon]
MPKYNPKHHKPRRYSRQPTRKMRRFALSKHQIIMIAIAMIVVGGMVIVTVYVIKNKQAESLFVEIGDTINVRYILWLSNKDGEYVDKLQTGELNDLEMKSTAKETGLIWGFWDALKGMPINVSKDIYLEECIDDGQARPSGVILDPSHVAYDNWDDRYPVGQVRAKSYGYDNNITSETTGEEYNLRFTPLRFRIEVISIQKPTETEESFLGPIANYSSLISITIFQNIVWIYRKIRINPEERKK